MEETNCEILSAWSKKTDYETIENENTVNVTCCKHHMRLQVDSSKAMYSTQRGKYVCQALTDPEIVQE